MTLLDDLELEAEREGVKSLSIRSSGTKDVYNEGM